MDKFVSIGKIIGSHGINGFAKIFPLTDFVERFEELERVFLFSENKLLFELKIENIRYTNKNILIKFDKFVFPEEVNKYKGTVLKVPFEERFELPEEDTFYLDDLIKMSAYSETGVLLGKVKDIYTEPDILEIITENKKEVMVPFVKDLVTVLPKENKIIIKNLSGLFDSDFEVDN